MSWDSLDYFISMEYSAVGYNDKEKDELKEKCPFEYTQGFSTMQNAIDKIIINKENGENITDDMLVKRIINNSFLLKEDKKKEVKEFLTMLYNNHPEEIKPILKEFGKEYLYNYEYYLLNIVIFLTIIK